MPGEMRLVAEADGGRHLGRPGTVEELAAGGFDAPADDSTLST